MASHKLDKLFKKKIGNHSTLPSADAWAKMESMLAQPKKKPVWFFYKVAAAILLLLSAAFVLFQYQTQDDEQVNIASIDSLNIKDNDRIAFEHPTQIEIKVKPSNNSIETKEIGTDKKEKESSTALVPIKSNEVQLANNDNSTKPKKVSTHKSIIPKEEINYEIMIEDEMIAMNDSVRIEIPKAVKFINPEVETTPKKKERKPIRIIYKRGNKTLVAANDTTSRKKFFHSIKDATKNIGSGDLIAKIRDAKDDFFSQGIDFKKSK